MELKYACKKDKEEFFKIFQYNMKLLCGDNQAKKNAVGKEILEALKKVEIVPNGANETLDKERLEGNTIITGAGNSEIYMKGFKSTPEFMYNERKHTFSHELWHAIYAKMNRSKDGVNSEGKRILWVGKSNEPFYFGAGAAIAERDTGKRYGKLFEETMMDIKVSISLAEFDSEYQMKKPGVNTDVILSEHIDKWSNNDQSGYSALSSITRLMIAAFANEPDLNYHSCIQNGAPIDDLKVKKSNGTIMYANDFLYGMMYDPIFIMEEYDKYMGDEAYINLLKTTDSIYEQETSLNEKMDPKLVKQVMSEIPKFANLRTTDLKRKGVFTDSDINKLSSKFNRIWNSMQNEYKAYFSQEEIRNI